MSVIKTMKNIFIILSPPLCGARYLACALQAVGVDIGIDLNKPEDFEKNEFFEDKEINKINKEIISYLSQKKKVFNLLESNLFVKACSLIEKRTQNTNFYGLKNSLLVRVLPFWHKVFEKLSLKENYILGIRNPRFYENHKNQVSHIDKSLWLWLNYFYSAVNYTQKMSLFIIDYDENIRNPNVQLINLQNAFNLLDVFHNKNEQKYCDDFISAKLNTHQYNDTNLEKISQLFSVCSKIYQCLLRVALNIHTLEDESFKTEWALIQKQISENYTLYQYIGSLTNHYEQEIRKLQQKQQSVSWNFVDQEVSFESSLIL